MSDKDSLRRYFNEIRGNKGYPLEEEALLLKKAKEGDQTAQEKIIKAHLRFVVKIARMYRNKGLDLSDLISEGNSGLLKAIENFKEEKNVRFLTYAGYWIRKNISLAIQKQSGLIHVPISKQELKGKIEKAQEILFTRFEAEPSIYQIAEYLNLPEETVRVIIEASEDVSDLNAPIGENEEFSLIDIVKNKDATASDLLLENQEFQILLKRHLSVLTERQQEVIMLYYGLDGMAYNFEEIAERLGISSARVREIKDTALKRLKARMEEYDESF
jgi:RNA polymerase primary sigma factor